MRNQVVRAGYVGWMLAAGIGCGSKGWLFVDDAPPVADASSLPDTGNQGDSVTISDSLDTGVDSGICLWKPSNAGLRGGSIQSLDYDPRVPRKVFAWSGPRLYQSTDGSVSWSLISELEQPFYRLQFPPGDPNVLFAATGDGILKSVDGGRKGG